MYYSAFIIGFLGSLHCIGMCGPIALAIPSGRRKGWSVFFQALQYNSGRVFTYALLGTIFGFLGQSVRLAGFQSGLAIVMGVLLGLLAFFTLDFEQKVLNIPFFNSFYKRVQNILGQLLRTNSSKSAFLIGILNGFLPCGLVYAAIFGAISTEFVWRGTIYMVAFGLGTFPMMLSVAILGQWMSHKWRNALRKLLPVFLIIMALLLISRGLDFDLPYDFRFWQDAAINPMCH